LQAAFATHNSWAAFLVGLAASLGAGISMGFAEALSDDGTLTGRVTRDSWRGLRDDDDTRRRGHTLALSHPNFQVAFTLAFAVVLVELGVITWDPTPLHDTPVCRRHTSVRRRRARILTGVLIGQLMTGRTLGR